MALDFTPGIYHGVLVEVVEDEGTGLVGDYAVGATVLTVGSGGALDLAGTCRIAGTDCAYTRDGETVTITPGLAAAAEDGDPVVSLGVDGRPNTRKQVVVDLDMTGDEDEEFPRAWVPGEWSGFYPLGTALAGSDVTVRDVPDGYEVVGRPHAAPKMDGASVALPAFYTFLPATLSIPTDVDTPIDGNWAFPLLVGSWTPLAGNFWAPDQIGRYLVAFGARWASNGAGSRRAYYETYDSETGVTTQWWRDARPADVSAGFSNLVVAMQTLGPTVGIGFGVNQSSGAALDLRPGRENTFFQLVYLGEA